MTENNVKSSKKRVEKTKHFLISVFLLSLKQTEGNTMKNELSRMTIDMPTSTHKKFKQLAAQHGISMRQLVIDYINEKIEQESQECPYDHTPNAKTKKVMRETDKGKSLVRSKNAKDLFKKLGI